MKQHVTDEQFEIAYDNQDNKNIIKAVTKKYANKLSTDSQRTCGMYGLWRCIQNHDDKYGRKFTTSLFIHVDWECKRELAMMNKKTCLFLASKTTIYHHQHLAATFQICWMFSQTTRKKLYVKDFMKTGLLKKLVIIRGIARKRPDKTSTKSS